MYWTSPPYQPTCVHSWPQQMTMDSDVSVQPSDNLGQWARYPIHADRGVRLLNQARARGPG